MRSFYLYCTYLFLTTSSVNGVLASCWLNSADWRLWARLVWRYILLKLKAWFPLWVRKVAVVLWREIIGTLVVHPLVCWCWLRILVFAIAFLPVVIVDQVSFVCNEYNNYIPIWELSDFLKPVFKIDEWLIVCHVINEESPHSESVMCCRDAQKLSSSWGIPNLGPYFLDAVREVDSFKFEFYTVSCFWIRIILISCDSQQKIGFSNELITYHNYFVEVVELFIWVIERIWYTRELTCTWQTSSASLGVCSNS